jgi:hypothetical protein
MRKKGIPSKLIKKTNKKENENKIVVSNELQNKIDA